MLPSATQRHTQFECMNEPPQCQVISAATPQRHARQRDQRHAGVGTLREESFPYSFFHSFTANARIMPPLPEEARDPGCIPHGSPVATLPMGHPFQLRAHDAADVRPSRSSSRVSAGDGPFRSRHSGGAKGSFRPP